MIGLAGLGISFLTDLIGKYGEPLIAKGIEKVTGIDVTKQELTQEDKQKIMDSQIEIMKIDFEKLKEENRAKEFVTIQNNTNTSNARENNTKVQESSNSSWLAKNTPFILDFVIVFAVFILGYSLLYVQIPEANIQIMNIMFGTLLGILGTVYNYHRGSSNGSASKSEIINTKLKG
jgi:maltodextrin utilization protein YvdJ